MDAVAFPPPVPVGALQKGVFFPVPLTQGLDPLLSIPHPQFFFRKARAASPAPPFFFLRKRAPLFGPISFTSDGPVAPAGFFLSPLSASAVSAMLPQLFCRQRPPPFGNSAPPPSCRYFFLGLNEATPRLEFFPRTPTHQFDFFRSVFPPFFWSLCDFPRLTDTDIQMIVFPGNPPFILPPFRIPRSA